MMCAAPSSFTREPAGAPHAWPAPFRRPRRRLVSRVPNPSGCYRQAVTGGLQQLTLRPAVRRGQLLDGTVVRHPESHFFDFDIDSRPLREWFPIAGDCLTIFNRPWLHVLATSVDELTGRASVPGLADGRLGLLWCAECGDIGCGALTAKLTIEGDVLGWSEFAWENSRDDALPQAPGLAFTFDRAAYTDLLDHARGLVAQLPYDRLEHEGRRFLWPWQWGWRLPQA